MKKLLCMLVLITLVLSSCGGNNTSPVESIDAGKAVKMPELISLSLPEAKAALVELGFTNIKSEGADDLTWDENRWIVAKQNKDPGSDVKTDTEIVLTCKKLCQVYIQLTSESNLLFSTYDIDVYLGEEKLGTIGNGETFTHLIDLAEDEYELIAYNSGNNSIKATKKLQVNGDITVCSDISHGKSSIEFKNIEITEGVSGTSLEMVDVTYMVLRDAVSKLESIGFINVHQEPHSDIWDTDNWIVTRQNIAAGEVVDKNEYIQIDCLKINEFFNNTYANKTLEEAQKIAAEDGFSLVYQDAESGLNLDSKVAELDEENKQYWIVDEASNYSGAEKTALLSLTYIGTPEERAAAEEQARKESEEQASREAEEKAKKESEEQAKKAAEEQASKEAEEKAKIITIDDPEFAQILKLDPDPDFDGPIIKQYTKDNRGRTVQFDGHVFLMDHPREGLDTIFNVYMTTGNANDYNVEDLINVDFMFKEVGFINMHVSGTSYVAPHMDFTITGTISGYDEEHYCIMLKPVSMVYRGQ